MWRFGILALDKSKVLLKYLMYSRAEINFLLLRISDGESKSDCDVHSSEQSVLNSWNVSILDSCPNSNC